MPQGWKVHVDARARAIAFDVQPSLKIPHDHRDAGESKSWRTLFGAEERIDGAHARVAKQTMAGVGDGHANEALHPRRRSNRAIDRCGVNEEVAAIRHRVPAVRRKVEERPLELHGLGLHEWIDSLEAQRHTNFRSEDARQHAFELRDELVDVDDRTIGRCGLAYGDQLSTDMKRAIDRTFELDEVAIRRFSRREILPERVN